jgi:hypothetical protein
MSGQHSQATTFRYQARQFVAALEKAHHAAKQLPLGYDAEIPALQGQVKGLLRRAQRMCKLANEMVRVEEEFFAQERKNHLNEKAEKGG